MSAAKKRASLSYNFFMNFLLTASSILFPLITFPYVSRVLGPAGTGSVSAATALVSYFTMIAMLGVPTYGIRAVAKVKDDQQALNSVVQELLWINTVMSLISFGLFLGLIWLVPTYHEQMGLYLICSAAIFLNVFGVNWLYQGLEQYSFITAASLVFKLIALAGMFLFVRSFQDVNAYGAITTLSAYGSGLINFWRLKKLVSLRPVRKYQFARHIKPIFTFFAMSVATTVYTNLDMVMLQYMQSDEAAGYYTAAVKIKGLMVSLITSLGTVLLPRLSYAISHKDFSQFDTYIVQAVNFVLLFSVPCSIYLVVQARDVILLLSGSSFLPAVACSQIITPTILLIGLSNITGIQVLIPMDREKVVLLSVSCGAIVDAVLNLILIPLYSAAGAAFATLAAESVVLCIQCYYLRRFFPSILPAIEWKILLAANLFAAPVLFVIPTLHLGGSFCILLVSGVFYFGIYGLVLLLSKEKLLMHLLHRK